jgi:precorrin-6B methylase 1
MTERGSLVVVGTGIRFGSQLTFEARSAIEQAEVLMTIAIDPLMQRWLEGMSTRLESFHTLYQAGKNRRETYETITERIVASVRAGKRTCFVVYGHPGVLVHSAGEAIRRVRSEGFSAEMLPAISAEDCLFADLCFDLASCGCQSYEVNDFLIYRRPFDPSSALILWQIALAGESGHTDGSGNARGLRVLGDYLARRYPPSHRVVLYEAAQYPLAHPRIEHVALETLHLAAVSARTTLFVPPAEPSRADPEMLRALGYADK